MPTRAAISPKVLQKTSQVSTARFAFGTPSRNGRPGPCQTPAAGEDGDGQTRRALLARASILGLSGLSLSGLGLSGLGFSVVGGGALGLTGCSSTPPPVAAAPTGEPAHPLSGITSFDGAALTPPALLGRVTVIDFWASWCGPCRQAFRYLDQLFRTFQPDGLQVVGVCLDEDPAKGRAFRARMRPQFSVAWDPSGQVRDRFRVVGLPTTILIDEDARLVYRHEGFDVTLHRVLETHVRRLVREG